MTVSPPPTLRSGDTNVKPVYVRRELDIFASLGAHWLSCCLIFAVVATGLGALALKNESYTYTSSAAIKVARSFPRTLQADRELDLGNTWDYDSFRNDQVAMLYRSDVLKDALEECNQMGSPWAPDGSSESAVIIGFGGSLSVTVVPKSTRIEISLQSSDKDALQPALNALLNAFEDAHRREYFFSQDARPKTLRNALAEVEQSIDAKRGAIHQLTTQLGVTNFATTTTNPWLAPLEVAREELLVAQRTARRSHSELEALRAIVRQPIVATDLLTGAVGWGPLSVAHTEFRATMTERYTTLRTELAALGEGHPGRATLLREMQSIEGDVTQLRKHQLEGWSADAENAVRESAATEVYHQQQTSDLEARNIDFLAGFQQGRILEDELPHDISLRDRLNQRLEFFEFEAQSPSYAEIVQKASRVDPEGESNLKKGMAIALFLAFALALSLPVLWDLRDDRVHTPEDVRRALGFPLAGWLPKASRVGANKLRLSQTQRLAQALDRDRKSHGARLLVFTGVKSDGALPLVRSVAESLCDLGRRVLVVDAIGGTAGEHAGNTGLLGLLAGDPLQVIPTQDDGDFLPRGTAAGGIPNWDSWAQVLSNAAATYDLILVAGPALLASPAAEMLVTEADLSVLVVEAESERLGELGRAGQVLNSLKPKAVGAVLTNVRAFRSRGYYRRLS